ncbi:putative signal transduction protein [Syntrophobacter sp. SbD1]|nr:putative signal transduction protein [Syntrophobacter sp. SbD1]
MAEKEIDLWVTRLVQANMPIFTRTVERVAAMANNEESSLSELAWSILEDPALTTQVLKLANSIYYNPYSKRINTVSRAVMRLGSDTVKEICLTISLIETVLSSRHKEKVALEIARAFHAAVQAKKMAIRLDLAEPEEVFIAALLTRIGNIAFWCFAGEAGDRLESAMLYAEREDKAEMEVLGFKLERLTLRLSHEWKLSDLLERALQNKNGTDPLVHSVRLGYAVAQASEKGWDCPQIIEIIKEAGDFLSLSEKETTKTLHESARDAAEITESCGAKSISRLVPRPAEVSPQLPVQTIEIKPTAKITESCEAKKSGLLIPRPVEATSPLPGQIAGDRQKYPKPDPGVQLCSLRDLSTLVASGRGDVNMVLSIVLEGIYRGIGMDRVMFSLLTPDRQHLKGKYGLGWTDDGYVESFITSANSGMLNIFGFLLNNRKPIWVPQKPDNFIKPLLTEELSKLTGGGPFFAMPIAIKTVAIGIICADRSLSGLELDEESFESFAFFGQQANMSLSSLAGG